MPIIAHDRYDEEAYRDAILMHPQASQISPIGQDLTEDLFYSFHQTLPRLASREVLSPSRQVYHKILEEIINTYEWNDVRGGGTVDDPLYSIMAAKSVAKSVIGKLEAGILRKIEQLRDAEPEIERLFGEAETYDELAQGASDDKARELYKKAEESRKKAAALSQAAERAAHSLDGKAEQIEDSARQSARQALEEAESDIKSTQAAIETFTRGSSSGGSGNGSAMTAREKIELATKVGKSDRLKHIAELTGRMNRIALQTQKSKVKHPPDEIVGITTGKDLGKVLPVELGQLADPDLEPLFFKKYIEGQLLQFDMRGSEKQGRGPIIVALDSSGSMQDTLGNSSTTKEVWSKSVMLALLAIAHKEKRDFAAIHFSHGQAVKVFEFSKGEVPPSELIAATDFFICGGTSYDEWMKRSLKLVERSKFNRADTICISDGEVYITDELEKNWNSRRKARDMRCYSVLLGDEQGGEVLSRISDAIATVDDLRDDNDALNLMFSI